MLAPTGVAALNVQGQTVHRFFGFRIDVTPDKVRESRRAPRHPEIYKNVRTIIIDEASMLRADLLDCVDQFLRKHGAQVMMLNNDSDRRWVNGSVGVIEHVEEDEDREACLRVRLRDGDDLVSVEPYKWELIRFGFKQGAIVTDSIGSFTQLPFRLAWAITIHKSQGKTFENVIIDLERGAFAAGQTYVALSRCTSFGGTVLSRPIKSSSIRADWRIQKFLTEYRYAEAERAMTTTDKKAAIRRAIDSNARTAMTYLKPNDTRSERVVVPLKVGTESYRGKQFLGMRAHCLLRGGERVFRVDRILKLEVRRE